MKIESLYPNDHADFVCLFVCLFCFLFVCLLFNLAGKHYVNLLPVRLHFSKLENYQNEQN